MPRLGCIASQPTIAWGSHLCTFYRSPADLLRLVTAYVQAGLEDGEACLWVLPPATSPLEAISTLQANIPHIHESLSTQQLELIPCYEWYVSAGTLETEKILAAWSQKVAQATSRFAGLRVTGDTSWLQSKAQRDDFIAYERQVTKAAQQTQIIALCTYPAADWNPDEMLSVMQCHGSVLLPNRHGWKTVEVCGV